MKKLLLILAALVGLAAFAVTYAESNHMTGMTHGPAPHAHDGWKGECGHDPFGSLKLTPEQQTKVQDIVDQVHSKFLSLKIQEQMKHLELSQLLLDGADRQAVDGKVGEIVSVEGKEKVALTDAYFRILALLSPEQKRAFTRRVVHGLMRWGMRGGAMEMDKR